MNHLHIISFDIPYPANYGGAIDVFYRIKALHDAGIKIILHCWYKEKRTTEPILESLCEKVYYYKRKINVINQLQNMFLIKDRNGNANPLPTYKIDRNLNSFVENLSTKKNAKQ